MVAFDYSAGFRLRFEHTNVEKDKPNVIHLEIKSGCYFGKDEQWSDFIESLPLKIRRSEKGDPALAYRLMLLIGASVCGVDVREDGNLTIETTDKETLTIQGRDDVWDESWIMSEPKEISGNKAKFIICDSKGNFFSG